MTGEPMRDEARAGDAVEIAWAHLGQPYKLLGDNPTEGWSCATFVCEVLQSVGELAHGEQLLAAELFRRFQAAKLEPKRAAEIAGCLLFWETADGTIRHVGMALGKPWRGVIQAVGDGALGTGGETGDAFVRVRPWDARGPATRAVDPFRL